MSEGGATWKPAIWVAAVFLLGVAAGIMIGYGYAHHSVAAAGTPLPEPERRAQRVAELTQMLGLNSDQTKQLDTILFGWHGESKAIHDQLDAQIEQSRQKERAQIEQLRQKGRDQIRAILTPEQKPKFEEFLRKLDEQRKRNATK